MPRKPKASPVPQAQPGVTITHCNFKLDTGEASVERARAVTALANAAAATARSLTEAALTLRDYSTPTMIRVDPYGASAGEEAIAPR